MILRFDEWHWDGVAPSTYKDEPGTWMSVGRRVFTEGASTEFEVRYFEAAAGGYTSWERHEHEHLVVVLRGSGRVCLDGEWHDIKPFDVVRVESGLPHQFVAASKEPLGILCVVDRQRDKPVLLDPEDRSESSND